jgi:hypothetical protein
MAADDQPDALRLTRHADGARHRLQQAQAALRRARDAHARAIGIHEQAARLFSAHGRSALALRERAAAQRERDSAPPVRLLGGRRSATLLRTAGSAGTSTARTRRLAAWTATVRARLRHLVVTSLPACTTVTRPQRIGDDAEDAAAFLLSIAEDMQAFAGAPDQVVAAAGDALRAAYAPYAGPQGVVMDGAAWLVSAHR